MPGDVNGFDIMELSAKVQVLEEWKRIREKELEQQAQELHDVRDKIQIILERCSKIDTNLEKVKRWVILALLGGGALSGGTISMTSLFGG